MSIGINVARERLHNTARVIAQARDELLEIKGGLRPSRCELSHRNLDDDPSVSTVIRTVIDCVIRDSLDPAVRDLRDAADYQPSRTLRSGLDFRAESEETRKALYDLVVRDNFTPQGAEDPEEEGCPPYTPEEAALQVFFAHGRWMATWLRLEEPEDLPEGERRELLVLAEAPDEPGRLIYHGV